MLIFGGEVVLSSLLCWGKFMKGFPALIIFKLIVLPLT